MTNNCNAINHSSVPWFLHPTIDSLQTWRKCICFVILLLYVSPVVIMFSFALLFASAATTVCSFHYLKCRIRNLWKNLKRKNNNHPSLVHMHFVFLHYSKERGRRGKFNAGRCFHWGRRGPCANRTRYIGEEDSNWGSYHHPNICSNRCAHSGRSYGLVQCRNFVG